MAQLQAQPWDGGEKACAPWGRAAKNAAESTRAGRFLRIHFAHHISFPLRTDPFLDPPSKTQQNKHDPSTGFSQTTPPPFLRIESWLTSPAKPHRQTARLTNFDRPLVPTRKEESRMNANRSSIRILIFTAVFFTGAAALAQAQQPGTGSQPMPSQQPQQQTSPGGLNGAATANAASPGDQMFVQSIFKSDAAEVQLGQLAQQKSQSDDVKQLGQKMVLNRTRLDEQFKPIADKLDVSKPKDPSKKDKQLIAKLSALSGPQFDEEYLKAVVKDNQQDVKDFNTEAQSAQDPNLQQAAKMDAPVLAEHLQAAEQIAQTHNVNLDAKK
jgi:putative membrane protein